MGGSALGTYVHDIQATRYSQLASGTIILYDHLATLDGEIELIWKSSWSWGKALFILNRYYGLISVIVNLYGLFSPHLSQSLQVTFYDQLDVVTDFSLPLLTVGWTGLIAAMIAEVILQMRLYAMYSLNKKVLTLMGLSFILTSSASAAVMGNVLSQIRAQVVVFTPNLPICVPLSIYPHFYAFWIPILAFETLLCGLALYKGYETFRSSASPLWSGRHLVAILIRDSVLYFLVMFATYLTNLLIFILASQSLLEIPIGFSVALSCVMGNRLVLNVREVNQEQRESEKAAAARSHSTRRSRNVVTAGPVSLCEFELAQLRSMRADV